LPEWLLAVPGEDEHFAMNFEQGSAGNPAQWFALRVKSRQEKIVALMARNRGFEEFLPVYESRRRWADRICSVSLPLFPGYVFCRLEVERRLPLLTIPGVLHFVGIGRTPVPIEETEIAAIHATVQSGLRPEPWPYLEAGQRVRLEEGPLAGMEGLLVEARKGHRIVVSVSLLKRSVAVEIDRTWVRPVDLPRAPGHVPAGAALAARALSIRLPA
jgi:transcription antitermination factor NusG